jgi:hypothetical protein
MDGESVNVGRFARLHVGRLVDWEIRGLLQGRFASMGRGYFDKLSTGGRGNTRRIRR